MLVALRDMPLGDQAFAAGDHIPAEVQLALPPGRLRQLKEQRYVEERGFEVPAAVKELADRLDAVEAALAELAEKIEKVSTPRKPGRPKKED